MGNFLDSPLLVIILFILRCLVPLLILLGVSYLLRKLGLVSDTYKKPPQDHGNNHNSIGKGGLEHGKS
jgi:hypothetical protein